MFVSICYIGTFFSSSEQAMGWQLWLRFLVGAKKRFFFLPLHPDPFNGCQGLLCQGVKQLEHKGDHSPPSRTKVKNAWSYNSTPPYVFMAWCTNYARNMSHSMVLS